MLAVMGFVGLFLVGMAITASALLFLASVGYVFFHF